MDQSKEVGKMLYGVSAIAEYLGMPKRATQHRVTTGQLPTFRLGLNICATRAALDAWLAEQEAKAKTTCP